MLMSNMTFVFLCVCKLNEGDVCRVMYIVKHKDFCGSIVNCFL